MSQAIVVQKHGGSEVLRLEEHDPGEPGPGSVRVRVSAIGVNFIDVYLRTAVSVDTDGWAHFDYVKMPDYRWGIFLTDPREQDGDFDGSLPNQADQTLERGGERWSLGFALNVPSGIGHEYGKDWSG